MICPFRCALSTCVLCFGCLIAALVTANHPVVYAFKAEARDHGAFLFHSHGCERCHKITGVGGDRAPDLSRVGERRSADQIRKQIIIGGNGMPPFKDIFSKGEVRDLAAFLSSCRTTSPPGCRQWPASQPAQSQ